MQLTEFALERFFAPYEFSVRHVLCASDCETMTVSELLDLAPAARAELAACDLGYSPTEGMPELRAAVADLYEGVTPEDVIVTAGGGSAIDVFFSSVVRPGSRVAVMTPCYQSLADLPRALGAAVTEIPVEDTAAGWALDLGRLEERLRREQHALLVINVPHNPTGYAPEPDTLREIVEIARRARTRVFADEISRFLEHDDATALPSAVELAPDSVGLGAMSKSFGLPGLRIGWLVARERALRERLVRRLDYAARDSSRVSQVLATAALGRRAAILARNRALLRRNKDLVARLFDTSGGRVHWHVPRAGVVGFPRLAPGSDAEDLFERLVARDVLIAPGRLFGAEPERFRIGFGRRDLPQALAIFASETGLAIGATPDADADEREAPA